MTGPLSGAGGAHAIAHQPAGNQPARADTDAPGRPTTTGGPGSLNHAQHGAGRKKHAIYNQYARTHPRRQPQQVDANDDSGYESDAESASSTKPRTPGVSSVDSRSDSPVPLPSSHPLHARPNPDDPAAHKPSPGVDGAPQPAHAQLQEEVAKLHQQLQDEAGRLQHLQSKYDALQQQNGQLTDAENIQMKDLGQQIVQCAINMAEIHKMARDAMSRII
jgi:hypothetical protein